MKIKKGKQRYALGFVISQHCLLIDDELHNSFIENGFKTIWFPKVLFPITTEFPCYTYLSMIIAVFRVYPKLKQYIQVILLKSASI
jgi:hypothetical protein